MSSPDPRFDPLDNFDDVITICPYCGDEIRGERLGCCGESSDHFENHYIKYDYSKPYDISTGFYFVHKYPYSFVNPRTCETFDEPTDETREAA